MTQPAEVQNAAKPAMAPQPEEARLLQRSCACGQQSEGECAECEEEHTSLRRSAVRSMNAPPAIPSIVHDVTAKSGRPLDSKTRAWSEQRFRRSFADVRVHTDDAAARSARAVGASAYTIGRHVVFDGGRFDPSSEPGRRLLAHELAHVVQQSSGTMPARGIGAADDPAEAEADRMAEAAVRGDAIPAAHQQGDLRVRRQLFGARAGNTASTRPPLIVEDDQEAAAGQMRRSDFLEELHQTVCATAAAEMARFGRSTAGCELLERYIRVARTMRAEQLESAMRRYSVEAESARSARDYIPIVQRRLTASLQTWGRTGQVTGVPPEFASQLGGLAALAGGSVRIGLGSLVGGLITGGGIFGGAMFKVRDGAAPARDVCPFLAPRGAPLETGVASRMSRVFGRTFSNVRVHTDARTASVAAAANATAFTIGSDIGFAAGAYRPGTPVGDALLAHELAHTVQQEGATGMMMAGDHTRSPLEEDADSAAVAAVSTLWNDGGDVAHLGRGKRPAQKSATPRLQMESCWGRSAQQGPTRTPAVTAGGQQTQAAPVVHATQADYTAAIAAMAGHTVNARLLAILQQGRVGSTVPNVYSAVERVGTGGVTLTFSLLITSNPTGLAANAAAAAFNNDPRNQLTSTGAIATMETLTRVLEIWIKPVGTADLLAEALVHEGTHMLVEMDRMLTSQQIPAFTAAATGELAALQRYLTAARASANWAPAIALLVAEITRATGTAGAAATQVAEETMDTVLEERFGVDRQAAAFPRTVTNQSLASAYVFDSLERTSGIGRSWPRPTNAQAIIDAAARVLDDVTSSLSPPAQPQQQPRPTPQQAPNPQPQPTP